MHRENSVPSCPLCASDAQEAFRKLGHWIYRCRSCDHLFAITSLDEQHVAEVYGDHYFSGDSGGYQDYLAEESAQRRSARHLLRQVHRFAHGGVMLDVGCAAGFLLDEFQQAGWQTYGVEPNSTLAARAAMYSGDGVDCSSIEQWRSDLQFDLITVVQVLPHLIDPRMAIGRLIRNLKPSGLLLIETWDRESRTAKVFGHRWHEYNPPSVLHWFSRRSLQELVTSCGPMRLKAHGRPRKRIQVGRSVRMLQHTAQSSLAMNLVTAPLRLVPRSLELPYPGDDAFWMIFRKNGSS